MQCATCHRGVAIPKQPTEILTQTSATGGTSAAVDQFRELRQQHCGGQSYDFSEVSLITLAQRANAAGRPDDALTWLQLSRPLAKRSRLGRTKSWRGKLCRAHLPRLL